MALSLGDEHLSLPKRFAKVKANLISGNETDVTASWTRLLQQLQKEVDHAVAQRSGIIPIIDFKDIGNESEASCFLDDLKRRGVAVIRHVIPKDEALEWKRDVKEYLAENPHTKATPAANPQLYEMYWSHSQLRARAHPNMLKAQTFAMSCWHSNCLHAGVTATFPVAYADRIKVRTPGDKSLSRNPAVDGGSVERWEADGYGRAGTYKKIFNGHWEDYDPWDSSTRLGVTSDLYNGANSCSIFRMFQGYLSLSNIGAGEGTLQVCPLLQHTTAYFLLRPFFSPKRPLSSCSSEKDFLQPSNWTLDRAQTNIIHGALPCYSQELTATLHPHLRLDSSLVPVPLLEPGDYVIWHPDLIHADERVHCGSRTQEPCMILYVPACPLTQTNALFLARQRKAFLLGWPGPDFESGKGESEHMGRPGVQEVNEAGGEEALRAMGLLEWNEEEAGSDGEREVLALANAILFPDRFEMT